MVWTFTNPVVAVAANHIEGVCIQGQEYADGGFCSGIIYKETTPSIWAIWFSDTDMTNFSQSIGFADAVDDIENWRRTDSLTTFDQTWTASRWLPKEARNEAYYNNEFRFTSGDSVETFALTYTSDQLYQLNLQQTLTLTGAISGVSNVAFALVASFAVLNFS